MSIVLLLHDRLATSVMLFFFFVGLWGLFEFIRGGSLGGNIAGALIIGQVLILVQGALGLVLLMWGDRPGQMLHILYGFTAALVLPFVWSYVRDRAPRQGLLLYSFVALFIFGLAIRGMTTAG
ncbi:MAG: hypothetical protein QM589_15130 [Thermomicrobiales bacterium]